MKEQRDKQDKHNIMKLLNVKDVAALLKAKPSTIYAWAEQELLPCFKLNGLLRFDEEEVIQWIKENKHEGSYNKNQVGRKSPGRREL